MRHILTVATAVVIGGFAFSTVAKAQTYNAGGPTQVGSMCKVNADLNGEMENFGYYQPCGGQALASEPRRAKRHR
jgi:hypothetical protein